MKAAAIEYLFKLRIGFKTICTFKFTLHKQDDFIASIQQPTIALQAPVAIADGMDGVLWKDKKLSQDLPKITIDNFIRYIPYCYQHCYIDLTTSFEQYKQNFSAKSLSTLKRKINKCKVNGELDFRVYRTAAQLTEFFELAIPLSALTYQDKLLNAGLPSNQAFIDENLALAENDQIRAYLLCIEQKPVAYLFCPVQEGVLLYAYLGYDPSFAQQSPGTVLQMLALESIFAEQKFTLFDFTEGQSPHKQYFSTHTKLCADVFYFRKSLKAYTAVYSHLLLEKLIRLVKRLKGLDKGG